MSEHRTMPDDLEVCGDPFPATGPLAEDLESLCARARAAGDDLVLLAGAISNGDEVADAHGAAGLEEAARQVVRRLVRTGDRVHLLRSSPIGGFLAAVVADPSTSREAAERVAQRLRGFVTVDGARLWPVVTCGLRRCLPDEDVSGALRDARGTLFSAGRDHCGTTRWHDAGSQDRGRDLELVADLAAALLHDPGQIRLAYQPVHDLRSGTLISAEALMRWTHPVRGLVSPVVAVAAAERSGLIHRLGALVLDLALTQTAAWVGHVGPAYRTHVNVSALELQQPGYVEGVAAALERTGVPSHMLLLEITETALLTQDHAVLQTLYRLRALGVGLGIDDFGTGYSSISHLHRLPIDTVKIDRSLVSGIAASPSDFSLVRTVLGLLGTTQVTVIAEGIEDAVQASHLQAVGAMFGQGYLLGRPVAPEEFIPAVAPLDRSATA